MMPRTSTVIGIAVSFALCVLSVSMSQGAAGEPRTPASGSSGKRDYPVTPVPFTAVKFADGFWAPRIETNRTVTIPFLFQKNEETGRIDNFAIAGKLTPGKYKGERYNDTDVYKPLEGAGYTLMVHPDPNLDKSLDGLITLIAAAQEPDGYLFTPRTCDPEHPQPGIGPERWSELAVSHELYNAGHLYEAAVAHYLATGKRTLLDVAVKNADLVAATFGPKKRHGFPGHQEIELALVKLYRVTGNEKYLALARYFLDQRGRDVKLTQYPEGNRFAIYNDPEQIQAHKPVLEQDEAVGHAVRLTYMASGMADIAALYGDRAYLAAVTRLWENVAGKKMYITGGVGSRHDRERFGANFELPNLTGYLETCASIGMALWNQRMFLLTGDGRYVDLLERVIYNGVLAGVSFDGRAFFYANPLESDGKFKFNQGLVGRAPFFETACCPGNISRFLPSVPGYAYAVKGDAIYVNLFVQGEAAIDAAGKKVVIRQESRYPWEGAIRITVEPARPSALTLFVRIPGWARGEAVPGGLYRFADANTEEPVLKVNGAPMAVVLEKGYARIAREWKRGDVIELVLPLPARRVAADEAVKDDAGKVAIVRGPLVYCAEWPDNDGRVLGRVVSEGAALTAEWRPELLEGVVTVKGGGLVLIPYYAWAHRGFGEMAVWLPQ